MDYYKTKPKGDVIAQWKIGSALWEKTETNRALSYFAAAIRLNPKFPLPYVKQGEATQNQGLYQEAVVQYSKALEVDSRLESVWINRGGLHLRLGMYSNALSDYSKVIQLSPKDHQALFLQAYAKGVLGDSSGAMSDLSSLVRLKERGAMLIAFLKTRPAKLSRTTKRLSESRSKY